MGAELKALGIDGRAKKQGGTRWRAGVSIMCRWDLAMHFKGNKVRQRWTGKWFFPGCCLKLYFPKDYYIPGRCVCVPIVKKFRGDIFSQFVSPRVLQLLSHHNKKERDLVPILVGLKTAPQPSQGPSQFVQLLSSVPSSGNTPGIFWSQI